MWNVKTEDKYSYYEFQVYIKLDAPDKALYFYNCDGDKISYDLEYELVPINEDYPEMNNKKPLYDVYSIVMNIILCCCFLIMVFCWICVCRTSQ